MRTFGAHFCFLAVCYFGLAVGLVQIPSATVTQGNGFLILSSTADAWTYQFSSSDTATYRIDRKAATTSLTDDYYQEFFSLNAASPLQFVTIGYSSDGNTPSFIGQKQARSDLLDRPDPFPDRYLWIKTFPTTITLQVGQAILAPSVVNGAPATETYRIATAAHRVPFTLMFKLNPTDLATTPTQLATRKVCDFSLPSTDISSNLMFPSFWGHFFVLGLVQCELELLHLDDPSHCTHDSDRLRQWCILSSYFTRRGGPSGWCNHLRIALQVDDRQHAQRRMRSERHY